MNLRPVEIATGYLKTAEGSALITVGNTQVLCAASVESSTSPFPAQHRQGLGDGGVFDAAARHRHAHGARSIERPASGRTHEIQRLIGRSLRSMIDLHVLGERSIILDCDVLQADGGTRVASITGAYVALALAVKQMVSSKMLQSRR